MSSFDQAADRINAAVEKAEIGSEILSQVSNGDEFTEVPTTSGPVPSLKKWQKDNINFISGGVIARVDKAILSYPNYAAASAAADTLADGQKVSIDADENRNGRPAQYVVSGATLVFAGYARSMNAGVYIPTPLDFGADPYGIEDSSQAMSDFWAYIKTQTVGLYPLTLPFCKEKYTIPAGVYRINQSVNWTLAQVRNLHIDAHGVLFVSYVDGAAIIDMTGARGNHVHGLCVLSVPEVKANSAILIGPVDTQTCGRNRFTNVILMGRFHHAAMHNHGSETTLHDACHYVNREGFALAGDSSNVLGATSLYASLRAPSTAISFTNNRFTACTFENSDKTGVYKDTVYLEGTWGWEFDHACYLLAWQGAPVRIREINGTVRNTNLRLNGLFETTQSPGIDYAVRIVADDGIFTALSGFQADFSQSHAKLSVIRVETPSGADLTAGSVQFPIASIRHDSPYGGATKLFDGAKISMNGEIYARSGGMVNVKDLVAGYGSIYVPDVSTVPAFTGNTAVSFAVYGAGSLAGTGMQLNLSSGVSVGFQGGVHPIVRALGPNTDHDLTLQAKGAGLLRFGTYTSDANGGYITVKDASGTQRKLRVAT